MRAKGLGGYRTKEVEKSAEHHYLSGLGGIPLVAFGARSRINPTSGGQNGFERSAKHEQLLCS